MEEGGREEVEGKSGTYNRLYNCIQNSEIHSKLTIQVPCPAVTPPLFANYFQEKEGGGGGGRNNEDLRFHLAVKPPPPSHECAYS